MNALESEIAALKANTGQWSAFEVQGHCVVLAPPGSGKTKLLTTRITYDLLTKITRPQGAACITLTNAAADELERRLSALGTKPRMNLFIGTIHSFVLANIIKPYAAIAGMESIASAQLANKSQADAAYRHALSQVYSRYEDTRYIRPTMSRYRKMMVDPSRWPNQKVYELAAHYERHLLENGLIDFDGIISAAVDLVEQHSFVRHSLVARFPHLYVDEYQDLAPGLDKLVRALCFDYRVNAILFAVGDPDQSIYGWTGSRPELLEELSSMSSVTPIQLTTNYRCGEVIIAHSRRLLTQRRTIESTRDGGSVRAVYCRGGFASQCHTAAGSITEFQAAGTPLHEIAVISISNDQCTEAARIFRAHGIPVFVRGSDYTTTRATLLVEGLAAWSTGGTESSGQRLHDLLWRWRSILGAHWDKRREVEIVSILQHFADRKDDLASSFLEAILEIGLGSSLERNGWSEDNESIHEMRSSLKDGSLQSMTVRELGRRAHVLNRVEITTISSCKGLEFDIVMLLGADEGRIPHFASARVPTELAEERRKFYVSITRARHEARIFYSGFVEWKSGKVSHNGPSRFLRELGVA